MKLRLDFLAAATVGFTTPETVAGTPDGCCLTLTGGATSFELTCDDNTGDRKNYEWSGGYCTGSATLTTDDNIGAGNCAIGSVVTSSACNSYWSNYNSTYEGATFGERACCLQNIDTSNGGSVQLTCNDDSGTRVNYVYTGNGCTGTKQVSSADNIGAGNCAANSAITETACTAYAESYPDTYASSSFVGTPLLDGTTVASMGVSVVVGVSLSYFFV